MRTSVAVACVATLGIAAKAMAGISDAPLEGDLWLIAQLAFIALLLANAASLIRANGSNLATPVPWFLIGSALYWGFGPLVYYFGSAELLQYLGAVYPVHPADQWDALALCAFFVALVLAGEEVVFRFALRQWPDADGFPKRIEAPSAKDVLLMGLVGGVAYLWVSLQSMSGDEAVVSGLMRWTTYGYRGALIAMAFVASRTQRWRLVFAAVMACELAFALLSFAKFQLFQSLICCAIALMLFRRPSWKLLLAPVVVAAAVYLTVSPLTRSFRAAVFDNPYATFSERVAAVGSALVQGERVDVIPLSWWGRLSYVNTQSYARDSYLRGKRLTTIQDGLLVWVPRAVWTDKPISKPGEDLFVEIFRRTGSELGIGLPAEFYWNGGWPCVVILSLATGALFGLLRAVILSGLAQQHWSILPVAALWTKSGFRVDGYFIVEVYGPIGITVIYLSAMHLMGRLHLRDFSSQAVRQANSA